MCECVHLHRERERWYVTIQVSTLVQFHPKERRRRKKKEKERKAPLLFPWTNLSIARDAVYNAMGVCSSHAPLCVKWTVRRSEMYYKYIYRRHRRECKPHSPSLGDTRSGVDISASESSFSNEAMFSINCVSPDPGKQARKEKTEEYIHVKTMDGRVESKKRRGKDAAPPRQPATHTFAHSHRQSYL